MIDLTGVQYIAKGSFGMYFLHPTIPGAGLKVYHDINDSIESVYKSEAFQDAEMEFRWLLDLENSGMTPKAYHLDIVKIGNIYYVAICMEHIDGDVLGDIEKNTDVTDDITRGLRINLRQMFGICHGDLHPWNVMVTKNKEFKVIDFGSCFISKVA